MRRTANIGRELSALDRLVAALFVLAGLAEDAAAARWPARCAMLWLLRQAHARVEAFAGRYVFWMGLPARPVLAPLDGDDPAAALSLAQSLRVLALAFNDMIARLHRRHVLAGPEPVSDDVADRRQRLRRGNRGRRPASAAGRPDTS
jgi:hypothetical protein